MNVELTLRRGSIHMKRADYDRHFDGIGAVVLLRDGADLLVLPVRHASAGGYVLKVRNAAGDRVVDGAEFLRANGIEDHVERALATTWSNERACLVAPELFV